VKFWSVEMLAEYLGVPKTWIYDRTRENGPEMIPHIKLGKYVRFNPESRAFQDWLRSHEVGAAVASNAQ
jgi:excisionase family DNA binding protein